MKLDVFNITLCRQLAGNKVSLSVCLSLSVFLPIHLSVYHPSLHLCGTCLCIQAQRQLKKDQEKAATEGWLGWASNWLTGGDSNEGDVADIKPPTGEHLSCHLPH